MRLLDKTTQLWVKLTGRKIDPDEYAWMLGPIGDEEIIADTFIDKLADTQGLKRVQNQPDFGLVDDLTTIGLSNEELARIKPAVRDFYENTYNFHIDFWSQWSGFFKPFGWLITLLFSRRLQQLNLPMRLTDSSLGLESNIVKLMDGDKAKWTIWFRKLKSSGNVIYSGIYTSCQTPEQPFLKVIFPLPNGNGTVFLSHEVGENGELTLGSDGRKFGDSGFYFTLTDHKGTYWSKRVRSMHEWITVYVDEEGVLRADHKMNLWGLRFMNLHYRMRPKA